MNKEKVYKEIEKRLIAWKISKNKPYNFDLKLKETDNKIIILKFGFYEHYKIEYSIVEIVFCNNEISLYFMLDIYTEEELYRNLNKYLDNYFCLLERFKDENKMIEFLDKNFWEADLGYIY